VINNLVVSVEFFPNNIQQQNKNCFKNKKVCIEDKKRKILGRQLIKHKVDERKKSFFHCTERKENRNNFFFGENKTVC